MPTATPICKQLCVECQHVLNRKQVFLFWTMEGAPYEWRCASKKVINCKNGGVSQDDCGDNYRGDCARFTPMDEERYNPREHMIP
jgi:hypothetical protein